MLKLLGRSLSLLVIVLPLGGAAAQDGTVEDARSIAKEAFIYAYPILQGYNTWYRQAVDPSASEYTGGFGKIRNYSTPYTPENHDIVTPNNDTPYSWAWLDLRAEPYVFSVPDVPDDRYYVSQWIDMFTYNFAYVGSRATGNGAGHYLIAGPGWSGTTPDGISAVFKAETDIVGTLTRTALDGPDDVPAVQAVQAGYKLQPLSAFLGEAPPPPAPPISFPKPDKAQEATHDFIGYLNVLLQFAEPPHPSEVDLREQFEKIGIEPGKAWDAASVDPKLLASIDAGIDDAKQELADKLATTESSNGLFGSREQLGSNFLMRAVAADKGLYGNSLEEAWYGGYVGDGSVPSMIRFSADEIPPAKFFWSMTLYTLPDRFLYANEIDRYSIGDRTKGLSYGQDGSLTLYVGHESPGPERQSNWLPAPEGKYSLVARVYGPSEEAMNGTWTLPRLEPAN